MKKRTVFAVMAVPALVLALWATGAEEKTHKLSTVSLRKMADSLHAVIAADQRTYIDEVLLGQEAGAAAVPGHAAMLRKAAQSIQRRGAEFSYTLRSRWPIDASQGPQTEVEEAGLNFVETHASENFYTEEVLGGRSYFTAVYASRATSSSCVDCHNQHPDSPRRDFKKGDIMGVLVVRVPLEF